MKTTVQKYQLAAFALWGMMLSVNGVAQDAKEFSINGTVKNGGPGAKVYLDLGQQPVKRIDSAQVDASGHFAFKGREADGGSFYQLIFPNQQRVGLLIEGGEKLDVLVDAKDKKLSEVKGSKNMEYYPKLVAMDTEMREKAKVWQKQFAEANEKRDTKKMEAIEQESQVANQKAIASIKQMVPDMGASLIAIVAIRYLNPEEEFPMYDALAKRLQKENPNGKQAKAFIENVEKMRGIMVGSAAPDIMLNNPQGQPVKLSSLRGKYVLIDFWASWCGPCRMENPNVVKMYNKYKDKGFEIYGVSLDRDKDAWVKAIEKDGLGWTHVSDLKYWQSAAAQEYNVTGIPATFLLDKEGRIIARNLRGPALEQKLEEVLNTKP